MVPTDLRERARVAIDQIPPERLEEVLCFLELMATAPEDADVEPEEMWLLATGVLKKLVDEIDFEQAPVDDWMSYLNDL